MRFSVECAFPHLHKRGVASRKDALCARALTERCTLCPGPHGKVHSGKPAGCRVRFSVRFAGRMRFSVRQALGERAKVRFSVRSNVQNALFREGVVAECAFP